MRKIRFLLFSLWLMQLTSVPGQATGATNDFFTIQVVNDQTGRGVPLVELRTVNKAVWWTDSNGLIAFDEPGLMDREVVFFVSSPGYEFPSDMFGNRGVKLTTTRGGTATIRGRQFNIAERLYRVTGQGIYRDSVLLGRPVPLRHPLLNGQVLGQDTVIATPYHGKIYWFWGDTDQPSSALGNFGAAGATSDLPGHGGLDPGVGVDLTYFVNEAGFSRPMCRLPGKAAHWIEGPFTIQDEQGRDRLVTRVANQAHLGDAESWDLMVFNDELAVFEPLKHWDIHDPHESAHPFRARADGVEYIYLFPNWRVRADWAALVELKNYEAFTCVAGDGLFHGANTVVERDAAGRLHYSWKAGADRLHPTRVRELISAGKLKPEESWIDLLDFETGERIQAGGGSVCWNDFRQRWVMLNAAAKAGEIWFAEADTLVGPWAYARRVVTHGDYNFYNPTQHPFFDQDGGRLIYFEGTYSDFFSGARTQTPRYDYNQLMYRLALDDPRLALPVAVYRVRGTNGAAVYGMREQVEALGAWERIAGVGWFALPPKARGNDLVPVYATGNSGAALSLKPPAPDARPLFMGLPLREHQPDATLRGSWAFRATMPDGGELKFPLGFSLQNEIVRVENLEPGTTGTGTFHDGKLILTLKTRDGTFLLDGQFDQRTLRGNWRQQDATAQGTWSATPVDTTTAERRSPALVALREYRRLSDGRSEYSTRPEPPAGCEPAGRELCRVWKAPGPALVLDKTAKAVP